MIIQDRSGDKKYFTIVPNFILNHSSANDQALYMQMKRLAGDNGTCAVGYRYFTEKLGIGYEGYKKSIKYLIEHNWIDYVGKKQVLKSRGKKAVDIYKVNDIWKMNIDHYCGTETKHSETHCGLENEKSKPTAVLKQSHCGLETEHYKEPIKNIKYKEPNFSFLKDKKFKKNLEEFVKMRKENKKNMTDYAIELLLKKLHKHHILIANYMLEKGIEKGWQGLEYEWLSEGERMELIRQIELLEKKEIKKVEDNYDPQKAEDNRKALNRERSKLSNKFNFKK